MDRGGGGGGRGVLAQKKKQVRVKMGLRGYVQYQCRWHREEGEEVGKKGLKREVINHGREYGRVHLPCDSGTSFLAAEDTSPACDTEPTIHYKEARGLRSVVPGGHSLSFS